MIVLGLNTFLENPSACLVVDGLLRAFCHEERFNRLKVSAGLFPTHATGWCLESQGLRLDAVDRIAISWDCTKYPWKMLGHLLRVRAGLPRRTENDPSSIRRAGGSDAVWRYLLDHSAQTYEQRIRDALRAAGHKGRIPRIEFVPHHEAHAFQAFHQSGFPESAVLVVDGSGEEKAVSGYHFHERGYRRCFSVDVPQSLGWFYGAFTAYLGFHASRDEGKLMGLAALGWERRDSNPWRERLDRALRVDAEGFELDPTLLKFGGNEHHPRFADRLRRFVVAHDAELEPVGIGERVDTAEGPRPRYLLPKYVDLAYAVQDRLELALLALVRRLRRETGSKRLCYAGGVAMNCKANGRLWDESGLDAFFVHPAASDDGSSIGAAFRVARDLGDLKPNPLRHAQLGPAYTDSGIQAVLDTARVAYEKPRDIVASTAELLAKGAVCGWFQGGVEMGARALGGRSIVACPQVAGLKDRLNRSVKFRETWRPYCPSLTLESAADYLESPLETPFMILARTGTERLRERGPATVHVDGTVRPQTVREDDLPEWHRLLSEVAERTGDPVLLNTSFNVRGEPLVCSPRDALRCFYGTGLDALALGGFLLRKPGEG